MHCFNPLFHGVHDGQGLGLTFGGYPIIVRTLVSEIGLKSVEQLYPLDSLCCQLRM